MAAEVRDPDVGAVERRGDWLKAHGKVTEKRPVVCAYLPYRLICAAAELTGDPDVGAVEHDAFRSIACGKCTKDGAVARTNFGDGVARGVDQPDVGAIKRDRKVGV